VAAVASAPAAAAVPRPAVQWNAWGRPLTVLGFTADGEYLVYTRQVEYYPLETIDDETAPPKKLVFGVVREARTGREDAYLLELSDESNAAIVRDEFASLPGAGAWRTWLAEHPLAIASGEVGPGGLRAQALGTVRGGALQPVPWQDGRYRFHLPEGERVELRLGVVTPGGQVWPSIQPGEGGDGLVGWAQPIWSPDGQRIAWWLEENDGNEHGPTQNVVIASAVGPRVELIVSPDDQERVWNALERLEAAGVPPVFVSRATAHIGATVVSAQEGFDAQARALLARLGLAGAGDAGAPVATVVPMARVSEYDLSVAAGPELMAPLPSPRRRLGRLIAADDVHTLLGLGVALAAVLAAWLATVALGRRRR
jgi:hypothetical protein